MEALFPQMYYTSFFTIVKPYYVKTVCTIILTPAPRLGGVRAGPDEVT